MNAVENGSYIDTLFRYATGWLGWTPEIAWNTPIPELLMALESRIEWVQLTSPFGGAKSGEKPKQAKSVADKLRAVFSGRRRSA